MADNKTKVLLIVEGTKTEEKLMTHLFEVYKIDTTHRIVPYKTNIYTLYRKMFVDGEGEPQDLDIQSVLLEETADEDKRRILKDNYSDIILIFDLDPQDGLFSEKSICEMQSFFCESTEMGKLYINYPMVEAFYHMKEIPDHEYYTRVVDEYTLKTCSYKQLVNEENRNHDYRKFAINKEECDEVIKQNVKKAYSLIASVNVNDMLVDYKFILDKDIEILNQQLKNWSEYRIISVLCCCIFYICDYNVRLVYG